MELCSRRGVGPNGQDVDEPPEIAQVRLSILKLFENMWKNITGKYFYQSKIAEPSIFAQSQKDAELLWEESLKIVKNKGLTLI